MTAVGGVTSRARDRPPTPVAHQRYSEMITTPISQEPTMVRWMWALLDRPAAAFDAQTEFWTSVTDTTLGPVTDTQAAPLLPWHGDCCVKLRPVAGESGTRLEIAVDDIAAGRDHIETIGGQAIGEQEELATLRSPGGLLFRLVPRDGSAARPEVVRSGNADSRLGQVCIDIGSGHWETELAFFAALTGWSLTDGARPEYAALAGPTGFPLRIVLQRLEEDMSTTAHVDIACGSDMAAIQRYHEQLGARTVSHFPFWTVMSDPSGVEYCLIARDPRSGQLV